VGVEQELFAREFLGGGPVSPTRVGNAIEGRDYARWVSFEPGGQVELSLPVAATAAAASSRLERVTAALAADLMPAGIVLAATPVRSRDLAVPRFLHSPRYDAMERRFDSVGPAGRRMMRATASTQICLDWWPGRTGLEQWRVLLLAAPFLAAATARSSGPRSRLATWLEVDPSRTAFDGRLLHGDDPVAAYADFAAGAAVFVEGGVAEHLSTLFPPVRPRGRYLEVRFPDARPAAHVAPLAAGLTRLLYDDDVRRSALVALAGEQGRLAAQWAAAAAGVLDPELGMRLLGGMDRRAVAA
jgi:glutamate--cysteine ligase